MSEMKKITVRLTSIAFTQERLNVEAVLSRTSASLIEYLRLGGVVESTRNVGTKYHSTSEYGLIHSCR
jgi:hypothetical protein